MTINQNNLNILYRIWGIFKVKSRIFYNSSMKYHFQMMPKHIQFSNKIEKYYFLNKLEEKKSYSI